MEIEFVADNELDYKNKRGIAVQFRDGEWLWRDGFDVDKTSTPAMVAEKLRGLADRLDRVKNG